ncbi:MAG: GxxExxY protein [Acidobacteria bacterium]|nr:GxxExxY protein [Acidobacteriota bacterium]
MELMEKELTEKIIGSCLEVSNELGVGFLESVYHKALMVRLKETGIEYQSQTPLKVSFHGHDVGEFFADLFVEGKVLVELKAVKELIPEHEAQLLNYLKASGIRVGLLVNFGKPRLQWKRFVL